MKKYLLIVLLSVAVFSSPSYAQITSAASGDWSKVATWVGGVLPGTNDEVVIADGHKVTVDGNYTVKNITVGGGTTGELNFSKTVTCILTVTGNILANAGSTIKPQSQGTAGAGSIIQTIILYGNLTMNGASFNLRAGSATSVPATVGVLNFEFVGSGNTTISGNYTVNANAFNAIKINKSGSGKVILGSNVFILGGSTGDSRSQSVLNFVNGIVETGTYTLVHQTSTTTNVIGASSNSYVNGNFGTALSSTKFVKATRLFPVGDSKGYRPITLKSTDSAGTSSTNGFHWITASVASANANNGASVFIGGIDKVSSTRYYKITFNKGTNTIATKLGFNTFQPSYGSDDGVSAGNSNLRVAYSGDDRKTWNGLGQNIAHTTSLLTPPTTIAPDSLTTPIVIDDAKSFYIALARKSGTTENSLGTGTAVEKEVGLPSEFKMSQNYPNPFNPTTVIAFSIPKSSYVNLKVYNAVGEEIESLVNEFKEAGNYRAEFNASKLTSGVYFYTLRSGNIQSTKKMILMK